MDSQSLPDRFYLLYIKQLLNKHGAPCSLRKIIRYAADFLSSHLNGKYKDNFVEQRINYYSAIRICRIIREAYSNPDQELKAWKTQTFDYISDTYRDDYPNGYKRLVAVLKKVVDSKTTAAIDSCDNLIQAKDRKGVCHLLANEGDVHWVQEDE